MAVLYSKLSWFGGLRLPDSQDREECSWNVNLCWRLKNQRCRTTTTCYNKAASASSTLQASRMKPHLTMVPFAEGIPHVRSLNRTTPTLFTLFLVLQRVPP